MSGNEKAREKEKDRKRGRPKQKQTKHLARQTWSKIGSEREKGKQARKAENRQ